jgi:NADH pyrophosphatase NudC (nudix superfamily)
VAGLLVKSHGFDGQYVMLGGHMEFGETIEEDLH